MTKIDRLGREIRDVKEVFSALKENLDQIMGTLQDGLMLFTRDWKVVLVSASAERFIGVPRSEMLGKHVEEVFDRCEHGGPHCARRVCIAPAGTTARDRSGAGAGGCSSRSTSSRSAGCASAR